MGLAATAGDPPSPVLYRIWLEEQLLARLFGRRSLDHTLFLLLPCSVKVRTFEALRMGSQPSDIQFPQTLVLPKLLDACHLRGELPVFSGLAGSRRTFSLPSDHLAPKQMRRELSFENQSQASELQAGTILARLGRLSGSRPLVRMQTPSSLPVEPLQLAVAMADLASPVLLGGCMDQRGRRSWISHSSTIITSTEKKRRGCPNRGPGVQCNMQSRFQMPRVPLFRGSSWRELFLAPLEDRAEVIKSHRSLARSAFLEIVVFWLFSPCVPFRCLKSSSLKACIAVGFSPTYPDLTLSRASTLLARHCETSVKMTMSGLTATGVPPQPAFLRIIKFVVLFLSVIVLALAAYAISIFSGYGYYGNGGVSGLLIFVVSYTPSILPRTSTS
jgi:hypothetical protein